jgi:hypothetical protein
VKNLILKFGVFIKDSPLDRSQQNPLSHLNTTRARRGWGRAIPTAPRCCSQIVLPSMTCAPRCLHAGREEASDTPEFAGCDRERRDPTNLEETRDNQVL